MATALIFGVNGQDGYYLERLLKKENVHVLGISRSGHSGISGDIGNSELVGQLIRTHQPEYVFHLAANSSVAHELLFEHQHTIVNGTLNILESCWQHSKHSRIFITGSGLQFENKGLPIKENGSFNAGDSYSLARIASVYAARYYRDRGLRTVVGYLFHHDSPLRSARHLNRRIVDAAKELAKGNKVQLEIGDVSVEKEFGFAGDIAEGILHLCRQNEIAEACIGTGKAYAISKWLELCFGMAGADWKDHVDQKAGFKAGFQRLVSDPSTINTAGWKAKHDIEELSQMMMNL